MKKLTLREVQLRELDLLRVFKAVCEANHLYYTICGGTLLGAVRHHGFIPWDDDVDVMMPRPDFDRLLTMDEIDVSMVPEHIGILSWRDTGAFPFIKLVDKRTLVNDKYSHWDKYLWVDVFPVDGCPEDDGELSAHCKRIARNRKIVLLKSAKVGEGKSPIKKLLKPLAMAALLPLSAKWLCERYDKLVKTYDYNACESVGCMTWGYGPQERIDREGYGTAVEFEFEGEKYTGPSNYHKYLTGLYGNYMKLPPEDQRNTRHPIEVYERG